MFDVVDCGLFVHYYSGAAPGGPPLGRWVPGVDGHKDPSNCGAWDATFYNYLDPTNAGHCALPAEHVYNPDTQPGRRALLDAGLHGVDLRPAARRASGPLRRRRSATASRTCPGATRASNTASRRCGRARSRRTSSSISTRRSAASRSTRSRRPHARGRREHGVDRVPQRRGDGRQVGRGQADHRSARLQRERRDPHTAATP